MFLKIWLYIIWSQTLMRKNTRIGLQAQSYSKYWTKHLIHQTMQTQKNAAAVARTFKLLWTKEWSLKSFDLPVFCMSCAQFGVQFGWPPESPCPAIKSCIVNTFDFRVSFLLRMLRLWWYLSESNKLQQDMFVLNQRDILML